MDTPIRERPTIPLVECKSSIIAAYGYDVPTQTLEIQFRSKSGNGNRYQYRGVEPELYTSMKKAPSIGRFFEHNIRGVYDYVKLEEPQAATVGELPEGATAQEEDINDKL